MELLWSRREFPSKPLLPGGGRFPARPSRLGGVLAGNTKETPEATARYLCGWLALVAVAGLSTSPLLADSFFTVPPCRVLDTRTTMSPVQVNTPTLFTVGGLCGIPPVASSLSLNATLVEQNVTVDLGIGAGDDPPPTTNVVSTNPQHAVIAGAAIIPLSVDGQGTVQVLANASSGGATDLTLDVNGYFLAGVAGGLAQLYAQGGDSDPGSLTDPQLDPQPPNTLGQTPAGFGGADAPPPFSSTLVNPIRLDRSTTRHFNYNGAPTPLIGVSADNACNLHGGNGYDMCTFAPHASANYQKVLSDAAAKGLNKIQLWVNINGGNWTMPGSCVAQAPNPQDQPFKYYAPGSLGFPSPPNVPPDNIGYFNLDERNSAFFANLQTVVNFAKSKGLFVEVTFFAPWIGIWQLSPWNPRHGRLSSDGTHTLPVGFSDRSFFVHLDGSNGGANANEALRTYQKLVIDWTLDALDAPPGTTNGGLPFDNVYFEIANEPENAQPQTTCGYPAPIEALASGVTPWQQSMIGEVLAYENSHYLSPNGSLAYGHLVAVQPFTQAGTTPYFATGSGVTVVNGHYTQISQKAAGGGANNAALGAITLARTYASQSNIILASNEGKISGDTTAFPWGGMSETCGWEASARNSSGQPTGVPGVDCFGEADSARAEAWEFMLDLGGAFDHFGYYWNSDFGVTIRQQLGALRTVLTALPLRQMVTSPDPKGGSGPTWVNIGPSPYANPSTNMNKYWAALQPTSTATSLTYVLYVHHSSSRKTPSGNAFLAFGGYQPIYNTSPTNPKYSENLSLCLTPQSQHYSVQWLDPRNGAVLSSKTISGMSACGTPVGSPNYAYDIVLKVSQVP
jgi:hypothetical protein